jgi:hypothetical protein
VGLSVASPDQLPNSTQNTDMARFGLIDSEGNRSDCDPIRRGHEEDKKKWMDLCEQAADEQDPKKLAALILQINYILEAEKLRLTGKVVTQLAVEDWLT